MANLAYNTPKELWQGLELSQLSEFILQSVRPTFSWSQIRAEIISVIKETPSTKTFVLKPNRLWRPGKPGQHIPITVSIGGKRVTRFYSLSSGPLDPLPTITVKKQKEGLVSGFLHSQGKPGMVLDLGFPEGDFVLPKDANSLLFVAGGSGITPIVAQLEELAQLTNPPRSTLLYFSHSPEEVIFLERIQKLQKANSWLQVFFFVEKDVQLGFFAGRFDEVRAKELAQPVPETKILICGPKPLKDAVKQAFVGHEILSEDFRLGGNLGNLSTSSEEAVPQVVTLLQSHKTLTLPGKESILVELEKAGIYPPSGCRMGICHSCVCDKKEGIVQDLVEGTISEATTESIRICVSRAKSPLQLDL